MQYICFTVVYCKFYSPLLATQAAVKLPNRYPQQCFTVYCSGALLRGGPALYVDISILLNIVYTLEILHTFNVN